MKNHIIFTSTGVARHPGSASTTWPAHSSSGPSPAFATVPCSTSVAAVLQGRDVLPYLDQRHRSGFIFKFFYTRGYVLDTVFSGAVSPADTLPWLGLRDQSINNLVAGGLLHLALPSAQPRSCSSARSCPGTLDFGTSLWTKS